MASPKTPKKAQAPKGALAPPQWRYIICQKTPGEDRPGYLVDSWYKKYRFDDNPAAAKTTGYAWSTQAEAQWVLDRLVKEAGLNRNNFGIVHALFSMKEDGCWEVAQLRFA